MNNITLGKYIPLNSFVHKLDPRTKIIAMMILLIAIFIPAGFVGYGIIGIFLLISLISSKLSFSFVWKSFKPSLFMLVFLLIINMFIIKTGDVWLTIGSFNLYSGAVIQTVYIVLRLLLMIVITTMLTATTKPLDLTMGLEDLLSPLAKLNVPTHDIAMMISLALRFIPTLLEEAQRILKAQASRGVDMESGSFKEKIQAILSLIVPLFVSSFQKADDLADAMEARGYVVGAKRVRYKKLKFTFFDFITLVSVSGLLVGLILLKVL
ncbi:MAG TPA: energy-coupling factor transporter transmembrane component T [Erysipelotrichaceae bacterium]|jgi:energy-coupling factor transport system permease protein|nr:energy-coupling factor transporter transmembrane protein EcfT [Erysipelotrichia bacterium]HPX32047.1 energy-coupling factor transporter transmembrane component T [Erysipelotrichaceae bacterium]HQA84912.1 energy-coupling factor transporter transmembrane component T [Erysipelotrichaceae bacterium]